ncbi:MAG: acetyl-CoA carboxylase carboxyl transferase subunit beta [Actinomycetia bacterium]|nr:acetyl-CoA carboxylase carboxyl transferase subunit beta [Actinomycetes bacterium]
MITRILIATRGPAATRLIRAYKKAGVATVAIFSESDREAPHVTEADEAYCVGPASITESYLNAQAILTVAELAGAHSIHPGYGLLAKDEHFRELCGQCSYTLITAPLSAIEESLQQRLPARRRIEELVDPGSFTELDAELSSNNVLAFPDYDEKLAKARQNSGETEAVITGTAQLAGTPVGIFAMDPRFMMGSMGRVVGEKITRLFEQATAGQMPVIGYCTSGGARMQEGILSLLQMAKVSAAVARHSAAGGLYVALLCDPTTGGVSASFAMEGDVILAEPGALIGFAGPRVVEQTTGEKLPKGFQTAEYLLAHGFVDDVVARLQQRDYLACLLRLHQVSSVSGDLVGTTEAVSEPVLGGRSVDLLKQIGAETGLRGGSSLPLTYSQPDPATTASFYSPYEIVQRSRDNRRPSARVLINELLNDFVELHGDRNYGDDPALVAGLATLAGRPVTVLAIDKGAEVCERVNCNFGGAHPEGYRKAIRLMKQAEKFGRPVVTLIDTAGAFCGIGAEERGQASAIAQSILTMAELRTPTIALIVGQGGSGGALALAAADRVWMAETASYSVISPEGCASILFKDAGRAREAAECLKLTAIDLQGLGVVDGIISERPLAGPRNYFDYDQLRERYAVTLAELCAQPIDDLLAAREARLRSYGAAGL